LGSMGVSPEIDRNLSADHVCGRLCVFDSGFQAQAHTPFPATPGCAGESALQAFLHNPAQGWTKGPKVE
jgi:hypothetical protein